MYFLSLYKYLSQIILGYGDLALYGHPTQPKGPLDEMGEKGLKFTQFYADSLCTPSRGQFLTGKRRYEIIQVLMK